MSRLFVIVALCLILTSVGLSLDAKDYFVSLDFNQAGLTGGIAEFTYINPEPTDKLATTSNLFFDVVANNTPILTKNIYIWSQLTRKVPVYANVLVSNKSCDAKNGTTYCAVYNSVVTGTKDEVYYAWTPFKNDALKSGVKYRFRVEATWKVPKLLDGKRSVSLDWIPYTKDALATKLSMSSWSWWNVTRNKMVEVNFTSSFSNYTDVELWTILNSTILGASPVTDTVYANDTEVTWLNTTSGLEQSIPYWFENYTDGGNSWLWIKLPVLNTAINNTIRIYYGSTDVTRLATYGPRLVFRRYNDFENYTNGQAISSDFGNDAGGSLLATNSDAFRGTISVDAGANMVYGFGTREYESGIVEMWIKAGGSPTDASFYLYNGINGILGSQLSSVGGITLPTAWTKVSLIYNPTKANVTIGATVNTGFLAYTENISQFMFPYYPLAKVVDDVRLRTYVPDEEITRVFSSVALAPPPSSLTITQIYPNNAITNTTNDIYFGYNLIMNGSNVDYCSLYLNGTLTKTNATALVNNSINSIYYEFANAGTYDWSIGCYNGTTTQSTGNRTLSLSEYASSGSPSVNELTRQPFNLTFTFSGYTYSDVSLVYNGSNYPASVSGGLWNVTLVVPIVQANNTNFSYYWNYNRTNASISDARSTPTASQSVYLSYIPDGSDASAYNLLEGSSVTIYMFVKNLSTIGTETVVITVNGVNHTATYLGYNNSLLNYSYTFNVGTIATLNLSKNWTWYSKLSYLGQSRNETLTTVNVTIFKFTATDCSYGVPSFVYTTYDEDNGTYVDFSDYSVRMVTASGNLTNAWSRSITGQKNITICVYPVWSSAVADLSLIYSGNSTSSYSQRTFYNFGVTLNNVTKYQDVYLLNNSRSYLVNIETRDQFGSIAPNILVYFERFNYSLNSYINQTVVYTTESGTGLTYLVRYDVPYKITLRSVSGNVLSTYENYFISTSSMVLRTLSDLTDIYGNFLSITKNCDYDTVTKVITCSYADPNLVLNRVTFIVKEVFKYTETVICNETKTTSSGEFTCDLSATDNASKGYYYEMNGYIVNSPEQFYTLWRGNINRPSGSPFGANGVLFAMMLFISMSVAGLTIKPALSVILGITAIFLSFLIGWLDLGTAPLFVLGTLIILGIFLVYKMRE